MNRRRYLILLLVSFMILTGCWSRKELNDYLLVSGIAVDKSGDQYSVTVQVTDPSQISKKSGGGGNSPIVLYTQKGKSISDALRRMTTIIPRQLYVGHISVLIISERLAREGITSVLDYFTRQVQFRTDFDIVVAKGSHAESALKILTPLEMVSSTYIFDSLKTSQKLLAPIKIEKLDDLYSTLESEGKSAVLTGLEVTGDFEHGEKMDNLKESVRPAKINLLGLTVFKGDRLVGWLNEDESRAFNYITNNVSTSGFVTACPKGTGSITYGIVRSKTKLKGSVKDGIPHINIHIRSELSVDEMACDVDLTSPNTIVDLQRNASSYLKDLIRDTIDELQSKYKSDIFGFGAVIHRSDRKAWKQMSSDWDKHFAELQVSIQVDMKIREIGAVVNPLTKKEEKE
ncbi:Ger(x)C family spore germination protein [Cohnella endophytica]|uniref:Ger(X)C family spore germination protein n=1 Tax=Cohnella endophytica TaxID=2419778 RepID=A0A494XIG4_9BACL|nr:Ger(x)C family spore germination protein [Cohnella endophytica]RKP47343.1 Ger(x)C family spore germination protein [Cohnella endophytica]